MDTWTDFIAEFLRRKSIRKATMIRAVMGGALAVQFALDHPEMSEGLACAWYQGRLTQKAVEVNERKGLSFLADVRKAFPQGKTEGITPQAVLQRLETIDAGFVEWSKSLQQ